MSTRVKQGAIEHRFIMPVVGSSWMEFGLQEGSIVDYRHSAIVSYKLEGSLK